MSRVLSLALVGMAAAGLVVWAGIPLLVLLGRTLGLPEVLSLDVVSAAIRGRNAAAIWNTVACASGATAVAVVWGVPVAFLVERTDVLGRRALGTAAVLPIAIPPFLLAMAALALLSPRVGLLGVPLARAGIFLPLYGRIGIALVLGVAFSPLIVLKVRAALARMDASLEEAARIAGASPLRALWDHTLPIVLPAVLGGAVLVFVGAAAAFGVPALLGANADPPIHVITTRIATLLQVGTSSAQREALGLASVLMGVGVLAFAGPAIASRHVAVVSGKATRPARIELGAWRPLLSSVAWLGVMLLIIAPLFALFLQSLVVRLGGGVHIGNIGVEHLVGVLTRREVVPAIVRSMWLAAATAAACIVLGSALVVGHRRLRLGGMRALAALAELVYAVPGTVLAVALILSFALDIRFIALDRITFVLSLAGTSALLLCAYVVKYAAVALRAADDALGQIHPSLEEAARTAGAAPARAFWDATLPLLRGHLGAASLTIFFPVLTELNMSILLVAPGTSTLGTVLFELNDYGNPQEAAGLAVWIVVAVMIGHAVSTWLSIPKGNRVR